MSQDPKNTCPEYTVSRYVIDHNELRRAVSRGGSFEIRYLACVDGRVAYRWQIREVA